MQYIDSIWYLVKPNHVWKCKAEVGCFWHPCLDILFMGVQWNEMKLTQNGAKFFLKKYFYLFSYCLFTQNFLRFFLERVLFEAATPARTLSRSGLKSDVLKLSFLSFKMMVKSSLESILKLTEPLQSCCCPVQKYLPRMAELAWQHSRYLWRAQWISK